MIYKRFELRDPSQNHKKFWELSDPEKGPASARGRGWEWSVTCRWGRIGTSGQVRSFYFATLEKANYFRCKKIDEKTAKGYRPASRISQVSPQEAARLAARLRSIQQQAGIVVDGKMGPRTREALTHISEPHTIASQDDERAILASDNKVLRQAYIASLPPLGSDPFKLPWE